MNILTFGSCLSRFTANEFIAQNGGTLLGAVYHNRIDRFVDTYIENRTPEIPPDAIDRLIFEEARTRRAMIMLRNQLRGETLGLHGISDQPGFMRAIETPVDLIIMDNFVDLCARHLMVGDSGVFLNMADVAKHDGFDVEPARIDISSAVAKWSQFVDWLKDKQPDADVVFMNFPFQHHRLAEMGERSDQFAVAFNDPRIAIIPNIPVFPKFIESPSHFSRFQYAMYAGYIKALLKKDASPDQGDVDL